MHAPSDSPALTFVVTGPLHPQPVAEFAVHDAGDVTSAVERASAARDWWAGLGAAERSQRLVAWAGWCEENADEFVDLAHRESGQARAEVAAELQHAVQSIRSAAGPKVRRRRGSRRRAAPEATPGTVSQHRVVAVLTGDAVSTPGLVPTLAQTLAAGSAVVVDVARSGAVIGVWWVESFHRATFDAPPGLAEWVTASPATHSELARATTHMITTTEGRK